MGNELIALNEGEVYAGPSYEETVNSSNATSGTDCDDEDEATYPGAAYNESSTECLTDFDGDGNSPRSDESCYDLYLYGYDDYGFECFGDYSDDSFYAGYLANVEFFIDGVSQGTLTVEGEEYNEATFCVDSTAQSIELVLNDPTGPCSLYPYYMSTWEIWLLDSEGTELFYQQSLDVGSLHTETITAEFGLDCDDTDETLNADDLGDGTTTCDP